GSSNPVYLEWWLRHEQYHDRTRLDRDLHDRIRERPAKDAQGPGVEQDPEQHRREALPPDRELSDVQPEVTPLPSCDAWLDAGVSAYPEPYRALEQYRGQHVAQPRQRRLGDEMSERKPAPELDGSVAGEPHGEIREW